MGGFNNMKILNAGAYLALCEEQLDSLTRLGVADSVVLAFFIVGHGVERSSGGGWVAVNDVGIRHGEKPRRGGEDEALFKAHPVNDGEYARRR